MQLPTNSKFALFMDQQRRFTEALIKYDSNIWFPPLRGRPTEDNKSTWYACFVPKSWGHWNGRIYGVHFAFLYGGARGSKQERMRLPIGVETPMKNEESINFKNSVISRVNREGIYQ